MPTFKREGIKFNYEIKGKGIPFLYLHGLGDNIQQVIDTYQPVDGIQLIILDQRGHGQSGFDFKPMSFDKLADDALALMDYLGIDKFYLGGLSMGAGVSVNLAIHHIERLLGLVLVRSAWIDQPMENQVKLWFNTVGKYLSKKNGKELFINSPIFSSIQQVYPRAIDTYIRYFSDDASIKHYQKFIDIPNDQPFKSIDELDNIKISVLILSNKYDTIHPLEYGYFYLENIMGAIHYELTPKVIDANRHTQELNMYINNFIKEIR